MEQNNKFFIYDSYVFAFKNALANARIFTISYVTWLVALIPFATIAFVMNRKLFFMSQIMLSAPSAPLLDLARAAVKSSVVTLLATIIIVLLLTAWITVGFVRIGLHIHDTGSANFTDLFPSPWLIIKACIAFIIFIPITLLGLICFIAPGLYFAVRAWFYIYALVEGEGIFESLSTSFRLTRGKEWQIFSLMIMSAAITTITLFFGGPILIVSNTYVYRLLKKGA